MEENKIVSSTEIGRRIKLRRKKLGLSQEALAAMLDVSYQQIQRYECGRNHLNAEKLQEVAKALAVPISNLVCAERYDGAPLEDHGEMELINHYRKVRHQDIKALVVRLANIVAEWEADWNGGESL